ncbi:sensor histidine kinase [Dactylosporangium sp. McL0621]|uniref:sensor histidine kinase n=1 Tax=Dactylosporangium sp. McL0621 TaxID=3415678 RepID=UPI003CE68E85
MARLARLIRRAGSAPPDASTAGVLLVVAAVLGAVGTDPFPFGVLAAAAATAWRRGWPTAVCATVGLGTVVAFWGPISDSLVLVTVACLVLACYSAAVHARPSWPGPLLLAAAVAPFARSSRLPVPQLAVPFLILGAAWFAGAAVRSRARTAQAWRAEAARTAHERDTAYADAVRDERARIARELHDVVTHRVSVMVIAAGAARTLLPGEPGRAVEQLRTVEAGGRDALAELRGLLSLLASGDDDAGPHPQPGLAALPALVAAVTDAGLPVTYRVEGVPRDLPPGVELTAYRIVQESLTNSLRHSTRAGTTVTVGFHADRLALDIADTAPAPHGGAEVAAADGRGLIGIRERVGLYGGTVTISDGPGRPYAIRAALPLRPTGQS